jgi:predicted N-acetyltransferase YhbS
MDIQLRKETPDDFLQVARLIEMAFRQKNEAVLVEKLRRNKKYNSNLSIVAEYNGRVIGHILFFPILIRTGDAEIESLALAPLSVSPEFQKMGVGGRLIEEGLKRARQMDYRSVIVLGHPQYYARFGFVTAYKWGISAPFEAPEDALMAIELQADSLVNARGVIAYPQEFSEVSPAD